MMQTVNSTPAHQEKNTTQSEVANYLVAALCLTIFPLIYALGKAMLYLLG